MEWTERLRMRQLYLLVAVHEHRNISRTASRMGLTQPGLSKWLADLENDLGVKLFRREARGLQPTAHCDALVQHARAIIGELDRTRTTIALLSQGATGNLVVGTTPSVSAGVVPQAAAHVARQFPDAFLRLMEDRVDVLLAQLLEGRVDFVITRTEQARLEPRLRLERLYPEHISVVVGPRHPLADRREVGWPEVMAYPWVAPPPTSPIRRELDHELALAGQDNPRYRVESGSALVIVSLLQTTEMVAPMSSRPMAYFRRLGQLVPLPLPNLREGSVSVIHRRDAVPTPLHGAFLDGLRAAAQADMPTA
ncbi:LysR family transcriptional regulator [Aquabacterium sp. J223]|uniref:LysR family transcriptional regulator n=1 Tax=Aquabacterium sp. J223 TaxID=2898431 RepID=UPI0021ADB051|nr:LysR family transcriptional regulator [Aquabacterium sp. J223]UUX94484.1 LysR family transcriptional regulator [Aquabacterium sp. J223]